MTQLLFQVHAPDTRFPINVRRMLEDILRPMFTQEPSGSFAGFGASQVVFHCAIADGEAAGGVVLVLAFKGYIGFANEGGRLCIEVPPHIANLVRPRLGGSLVAERLSTREHERGPVPVAAFLVELQPGAKVGIPLGMFGELGLVAA